MTSQSDPTTNSSPPNNGQARSLPLLTNASNHSFSRPIKRINESHDVPSFLQSKAYSDIMSFLFQLNRAMFPTCVESSQSNISKTQSWHLGSPAVVFSDTTQSLRNLIQTLNKYIEETPPDPGPRRFGNVAFRKWHQLVSDRAPILIPQHLPDIPAASHEELTSYFLGSFGSAQRLDYGSGHELSFLAFLGCIWKVGGFSPAPPPPTTTSSQPPSQSSIDNESRSIVLGLLQPYLTLIRRLILTYTLEPAGSHGVWGLDDHSFLPYIFGSAQYGSPIPSPTSPTPTQGSYPSAPDPSDIIKSNLVSKYAESNMYFSAIAFIHEVKKGPFWEHSPILFDISGVVGGWGKINKGMLKMYDAEVLGKFPVVQHFCFGSLFRWERDPEAPEVGAIGKGVGGGTAGQPSNPVQQNIAANGPLGDAMGGTKAPWGSKNLPAPGPGEGTKAPWAGGAGTVNLARMGDVPSRYPATARKLRDPIAEEGKDSSAAGMPPPTGAPWAKPP